MKNVIIFLFVGVILSCFAQYEGQPTLNLGFGLSGGKFNNGIFKARYDPDQGKADISSAHIDQNRYQNNLYPIEIEYLNKNILFRTGYWIPGSQERDLYTKVYITPAYQLEMAFGGYASKFGFFGGFHYFGTVMKGTVKTDRANFPTPITSPVQIKPEDTVAKYYFINKMGWNEQGLNVHLCIGEKRLKKFSYYINLTSTSAYFMDIKQKARGIGHIFEFSTIIPFNKNKDWGLFYRIGYRVNNTKQLTLGELYFPSTHVTQTYFMFGLFLPATILQACTAEGSSTRDNPVRRWGEMWRDYNRNR
ncbi:MAG: hypothetical protein NZ455_15565 [Bacteroidia bacterium]|nr:hypothetical protein [Bacteroidia bacterium]MDW8347990.1 hypothetical protein [Bacteroidia bacterium]